MSEIINYPLAIDPETGEPEVIGNGRIAIIGKTGIEGFATTPPTNELLDVAVAAGDLTYGA